MDQTSEKLADAVEQILKSQKQQHEIGISVSSPAANTSQVKPNGVKFDSIDDSSPLSHQQQQHEVKITVPSNANTRRLTPNLPCQDLLMGLREDYNKIGVPLYKASIKGDWKAARVILDEKPELVRYSITENGETALHVAASAKRSRHGEKFVKNLVDMMEKEDLALQNENHNTALYLAAAAGNVKTVMIMAEKNSKLLTIPGAGGKTMPLYVAALHGNYEVVKYMYENSKELGDDGWTPQNRGWLLQKFVEADMFVFSVIGVMVGPPEKDSEALQLLRIVWKDIAKKPKSEIDKIIRGPVDMIKQDDTPAASGKVVQALQLRKLISEHHHKMHIETQNILRDPPDLTSQDTESASAKKVYLALQLQELIYDHLVNIHVGTQNIIRGCPDSVNQDTVSAFGKVDQALQLQKLISKHIVTMNVETKNIIKWPPVSGDEDRILALRLQRIFLNHIDKMHDKAENIIRGRANETHSSRILFVAAEMGNTEFVVELIRQYPDLIWKVNDNLLSIFHVAVKYRRKGIYNLLYEIGSMKDLVTPLSDEEGNNMLHLAGKITKKKRLENVSGAALQMQRELLWFKEVESMIPPHLRERRNKDGLTPRELFTEEHKHLITAGEKWMKGTANQCMVVAALIATIVFAAAFTVPGGYDQNYGFPIFYWQLTFKVFVVADAISLFLSSASILTFLSILTSRYAERDFEESLPNKLMLGLVTLFLSITTMMVAFSLSFFVLYHKHMKWIPILIGTFAILPVLLYVILQYHLLVDATRSTYGSKYLFKPAKQILFYEKPKV
ncbi:uncharacterized protein [Rutidosis leptorrhynchoides]|uniref:uncharacterized protein isoform X2 n=1 Tax=Rutidosis leptorrhynchoides TaxID=125765 RepID=UPI003A998228